MANNWYDDAWIDGSDVDKDDVRDGLRDGTIGRLASVAALQGLTTRGHILFNVGNLGFWLYDSADTTTADDGGVACIVSADGKRYKPLSTLAGGGGVVAAGTGTTDPVFTFSDDTDTGITHPAADILAIKTGGVERMRINSAGVEYGTAPRFRFNSDGTLSWGASANHGYFSWDTGKATLNATSGNALSLGSDGIIGRLYIATSGNVGVLTTSPAVALSVDGPVGLKSYTVATVPSAATVAGQIIYVSNESGGAVPAFSDGTNWRRVTDRAVIS